MGTGWKGYNGRRQDAKARWTQTNEMAGQLAKEAATNGDIDKFYKRIPKSTVISDLSDLSVTKWQSEWDHTTKGAITKSFFPKIADRLKM